MILSSLRSLQLSQRKSRAHGRAAPQAWRHPLPRYVALSLLPSSEPVQPTILTRPSGFPVETPEHFAAVVQVALPLPEPSSPSLISTSRGSCQWFFRCCSLSVFNILAAVGVSSPVTPACRKGWAWRTCRTWEAPPCGPMYAHDFCYLLPPNTIMFTLLCPSLSSPFLSSSSCCA
jgi:hypothetical protein